MSFNLNDFKGNKEMTFRDARHIARMSEKEVSRYLKLDRRTTKNYERGAKTPKAIIECLCMLGGYLPNFSLRNDFSGWSFGNGFLWSPAGDKYTAGDILATIYEQQIIRSQRTELKALKKRKQKTAKIYNFPSIINGNAPKLLEPA